MDIKKLIVVLAVAVVAGVAAVYGPEQLKGPAVGLSVLAVGALETFLKGPPAPPSGLVSMVWFALAAIGALTLVAVLTACDFQKRPIVQETEIDILACVLTADTEDPIALIAKCGPKVALLLPELLRLKHAATAKGFKLCMTCGTADAGGDQ